MQCSAIARHYLTTFFSVALLAFSCLTQGASSTTTQTFQTCGIIASELLTSAQLFQKGIPLTTLYDSLPALTPAGKKRLDATYKQIQENGLIATYSVINSRFAKCAKSVFAERGKPSHTSPDLLFYYCAGENKLRYEYILALYANVERKELLAKVHKSKLKLASFMYDLNENEGTLATFDFSATELKKCMNR
ncbi:MAG: hypothetical protein CSA50_00975 [Gammaproteobacteria bacterium]|nr:MAG: hypothetical protein CSA50_00975 [Gammaproteobacteria bacterium]